MSEPMNVAVDTNYVSNLFRQLTTLFTQQPQSNQNNVVAPINDDGHGHGNDTIIEVPDTTDEYVPEHMELHEFVERYSYVIDVSDYSISCNDDRNMDWRLLQNNFTGSDYFYDIENNQITKTPDRP